MLKCTCQSNGPDIPSFASLEGLCEARALKGPCTRMVCVQYTYMYDFYLYIFVLVCASVYAWASKRFLCPYIGVYVRYSYMFRKTPMPCNSPEAFSDYLRFLMGGVHAVWADRLYSAGSAQRSLWNCDMCGSIKSQHRFLAFSIKTNESQYSPHRARVSFSQSLQALASLKGHSITLMKVGKPLHILYQIRR